MAGGATLTAVGAAGASPVPPSPAPAWAWGAATTVELSVHQIGAYNASAFGASGNLTAPGAFIDLSASLTLRQATYAVVTATSPSPGNLSVEVAAAQFRGVALNESVRGALPVAGSYPPRSTVPLANQSAALSVSEQVLDVAVAFLNYSVSTNGSIALADEHIGYARFVNLSLAAQHFPNVTANAAGGPVIRYDTGALSATGFEGLDLTGAFSPALVLVQRPLTSSSHWSEVVATTWNGTVAYASTVSVAAPGGGHAQVHQGAVAQFYRQTTLDLNASANGTRSVIALNGTLTNETVIDYTLSGPGGGAAIVDGLYVVPSTNATVTSTGLAAIVPERPATGPLAPSAGPRTSALVPRGSGLPTGSITTSATGPGAVASPMSPDDARAGMLGLRSPGGTALGPNGPDLGAALLLGTAVVVVGALLIRREIRRP